MNDSPFKQVSAVAPVLMSMGAIGAIIYQLSVHGLVRQPDETGAAHTWQLLMAGQIPVIVLYAIKWLPIVPRKALLVLGIQLGAAIVAAAPIFCFGW